ncbi:MAG: DUF481 domain-containing protein [Ginsengibacter sp.]
MYKIVLLFIAINFINPSAFSQFNDSVHHHFSFASTEIYNKTKEVSSFVLNNNAGYEINQKKISFSTAASWIYGKQQQKLSNNDVSAFANIDYLKEVQPLYYWALVNFDESYSLKVNYRFQAGVGVGYTFVNTPDLNLELSNGFLYETSDLTDAVLVKNIYQTVRNSLRLKYRWSYKNTFSLQGANFIQPSIISFDDYILKIKNQLSVKLNQWLSINASMEYNKISRTNRENGLVTYGLVVSKYF